MPETQHHLRCRDIGMNCDFEAHGRTEDEVVQKAAQHAARDHGVTEMTPDLERKVRAAVHAD